MTIIKTFCKNCNKLIERRKSYNSLQKTNKNSFCSRKCLANFYRKYPKEINCKQCDNIIINPGPKLFCNNSCSAKYSNTHKTIGIRISKLELYLKEELLKLYPDLDFKFNDKSTIQSELDIYIPYLKLAFEINGPTHYLPIYGQSKLKAIQKNDKLKKAKCKERKIKLITINTSKQKEFTIKSSQKYLNKVTVEIGERFELSTTVLQTVPLPLG